MATTAVDPVILDTNILMYAKTAMSPLHTTAVGKLNGLVAAGHPLWVSRQVFREYLAAMSRPGVATTPISMSDLLADIRSFESQFLVAEDGPLVTTQLLDLLGSVACGGKQIHDANIVATMLVHHVPAILTHNGADFARFAANVRVVALV